MRQLIYVLFVLMLSGCMSPHEKNAALLPYSAAGDSDNSALDAKTARGEFVYQYHAEARTVFVKDRAWLLGRDHETLDEEMLALSPLPDGRGTIGVIRPKGGKWTISGANTQVAFDKGGGKIGLGTQLRKGSRIPLQGLDTLIAEGTVSWKQTGDGRIYFEDIEGNARLVTGLPNAIDAVEERRLIDTKANAITTYSISAKGIDEEVRLRIKEFDCTGRIRGIHHELHTPSPKLLNGAQSAKVYRIARRLDNKMAFSSRDDRHGFDEKRHAYTQKRAEPEREDDGGPQEAGVTAADETQRGGTPRADYTLGGEADSGSTAQIQGRLEDVRTGHPVVEASLALLRIPAEVSVRAITMLAVSGKIGRLAWHAEVATDERRWVTLERTGMQTEADDSGAFHFENVPSGKYTLVPIPLSVFPDPFVYPSRLGQSIFALSAGQALKLGVLTVQAPTEAPTEALTKAGTSCKEDCRRMFEKGELRKGMSIEECIKILCESRKEEGMQTSIPLLKGKIVTIQSMAEDVWKRHQVKILQGQEPGTMQIEFKGPDSYHASLSHAYKYDGKFCYCCFETIKIGSNLKVPFDAFFTKVDVKNCPDPDMKVVQTFNSRGVLSFTFIIDEDAACMKKGNKFIVSGPEGAILQKEGKDFRLLEGEAYILQVKGENNGARSP